MPSVFAVASCVQTTKYKVFAESALYREAADNSRFMILSLQTWASGRPTPLRTLRTFLERITAHNDIRFASCGEIAAWCNPNTKDH